MKLFKSHVDSIFLAETFSSHLLFIIISNPCQPSLSSGTFSDGFYFQSYYWACEFRYIAL